MKRAITTLILTSIILCSFLLTANALSIELDFYEMFEEHGSIMLLIDSKTGAIEHANRAASEFYGYTIEELKSLKIHNINVLTTEEIEKRMEAAAKEQKNYFILEQRLANGDIRTVEVYSCPHTYGDKTLLFATIYDITDKMLLAEKNRLINNALHFTLSGVICLIGLFSFILFKNFKKLKTQSLKISNLDALRKTYIDSYDKLVYLKDENLKYVFVNKPLEIFYKKKESEIIGRSDFDLTDRENALNSSKTDLEVLNKKTLIENEVTIGDKIYKNIKFPVKLLNGNYGVGGYTEDITEEHRNKIREKKNLMRNQILVEILTRKFNSTQEQLDYVLNVSLKLTGSKYGYIYLYDEDRREFTLNSWSKSVMPDCLVADKQTKYKLENTGLWGEIVRQRKPIIINDYKASNPMKKGYPKGHVQITKFMSVPVIIDDKIVAAVGLANKEEDYDYNDVYQMIALMHGIWNAKERREVIENLVVERNKFWQTLLSIGDGVMVVDLEGKVTMLNKVAEKLTGWAAEEAAGRHYKEVFVLSHADERLTINDPLEGVLKTDTVQELENHAVLTSKDGTKYFVEDSAAPIKDDKNNTFGVVLVFRDITEKKVQREKIEYLSFHDALTGIYNRGYFEEGLKQIDVEENLPISIIVGDMNGLKLANDIFGHEAGDMLLQSAAETLKKVCRKEDIIARTGGDEFAILLPKTSAEDVAKIMTRIRNEFSQVKVKSIQGSMSLGSATKTYVKEDILQTLKNAESEMYSEKAIDRSKIKSSSVNTIIEELFRISPQEEAHSKNVSKLCEKIGKYMNLPEDEIRRLKQAGFLHDVGKVALDEKLLNKGEMLAEHMHKELRQHAVIGYRILNSFNDTLDLAESVLAHHENWDGSGYPRSLKGEEIPRLARIIAVAERYDAMTTKKGISSLEAMEEIKKLAGSEFDPEVVETFYGMLLQDYK